MFKPRNMHLAVRKGQMDMLESPRSGAGKPWKRLLCNLYKTSKLGGFLALWASKTGAKSYRRKQSLQRHKVLGKN